MPRNVNVGLIQAATPYEPGWSIQKTQKAALDVHIPLIEEAGKKVTNESVKAPLTAFANEYKSFVKVFDGFEIPDVKSIDATDPAAMDKLTEAQNKMKDVSTKVQDASTKLMDQAKKLQDVCTKG